MKTTIWKNDGTRGTTRWDRTYLFAGEGTTITDNCIVIDHGLWERMKQVPFYVRILDTQHSLTYIDIANGDGVPFKFLTFGADFEIMPDTQNHYRVLVDYANSAFASDLDEKNLLIWGEEFAVDELYFYDDVPYVTGGISLAQITEQWVSFYGDYIAKVLEDAGGITTGEEYYAHCGYSNILVGVAIEATEDNTDNSIRIIALSLMCGGDEMKIWETVIMQPFSHLNWNAAVNYFLRWEQGGYHIDEHTSKFFVDMGIKAFCETNSETHALQIANIWLSFNGYPGGFYPSVGYIGKFFYSPIPNFVFQSVFCRENEQMCSVAREDIFTNYNATYTVPDGYEIYDAYSDCIPQQYERSVDFAINWNGMGSNHSTLVAIRPIPEPPTPEPEDETCEMDFSAHTYEIIFDLFEKCEKYGFVLTDVKISNTLANGAVKYYRFNGYEDAFEYFNDNVRCRKINSDAGVWAVCSCIATRNLEYLPIISFKVTDILGDVKMKSNLPKKSKGRSVVEYDWSSENSKYTLAKLFIKYAKVVQQCNRAFQAGVYGNIDYIDNYWNGSINN